MCFDHLSSAALFVAASPLVPVCATREVSVVIVAALRGRGGRIWNWVHRSRDNSA